MASESKERKRKKAADLKKAKKFFLRQVRRGDGTSSREVRVEAKKRKWLVSDKDLKDLKQNWIALAKFSKPRHRPKDFITGSTFKLGLIQTDLAFVHSETEWRAKNQGFQGFFLAVDTATLKVAALPMRGKTSQEYLSILKRLLKGNFFPRIRQFVSDKDLGITAKIVSETLMTEFGIPITFQKVRHKAYLAERMIREVKKELYQVLESRGGDEPRDWRPFLKKIIARLNSRPVGGTQFAPDDVTRSNFYDFLDQRLKTDSSFFANTSQIDSEALNSRKLVRRLWKFQKGEKVLVNARLMPGEVRKLGRTFYKSTRHGAYFDEPFIVTRLRLRRILESDALVPGTPSL